MHIRALEPDQLDMLCAWLAAQQAEPRTHIGYLDTDARAIRVFLETLYSPWYEITFAAFEGETLIGCLTTDFAPQVSRAFFIGPFVKGADWQQTADALLEAALKLPDIETAREYELFADDRHVELKRFAERHDLTLLPPFAAFGLPRSQWSPASPDARVVLYKPEYAERVSAIHHVEFLNAHLTSAEMFSSLDQGHVCFVAIDQEGVAQGYIYTILDEAHNGYISYLAVAPQAHRRGYGRALVQAAVDWAFADPVVRKVHLTTRLTRSAAVSLYESFGFAHGRTFATYRKENPAHAPVLR